MAQLVGKSFHKPNQTKQKKNKKRTAWGFDQAHPGGNGSRSLSPFLPKIQTNMSPARSDDNNGEFVRQHSIFTISPIILSAGPSF